jgi:uncharacterized protein YutE (UPF0331/DUF86 family)
MKRIDYKLEQLKLYCNELETFIPKTFETYCNNIIIKAACERYIEKIVECAIDIAYLILKDINKSKLESDNNLFDSLTEHNIITEDTAKALKLAKGLRNIIAHQYANINEKVVFETLQTHLNKDIREFLKEINQYRKNNK